MGIFIKRKTYMIAAFSAFAACILMIVCSDIAVMSAKKGISLWLANVLPAMLPFFICVNFLTGIGVTALLPVKIFPFAVSALSGYPMGAKVVGDMYREGIIDDCEIRRLISFCSTSGPVFMIGAVGVGMLGSQTAGYIIAVSHYLGAIANGFLYTAVSGSGSCMKPVKKELKECDLMEELTKAIFSGFRSMAVILAYIIFFMFIMDMMLETGAFDSIRGMQGRSLLQGFIEMTVGCSVLSSGEIPPGQSCILASMIVSWGGLSVLGQSVSMLTGTGVPVSYLVVTKLTHSIFAGITALFLAGLML